MLISDSHQFIFLRMRKVASTSMKTILLPLCVPRPAGTLAHLKSRMRLETDYRKYVFRAHDDIRAAQRRMPADTFDRYFKFTFVRNPWDRLVSEYEFLLRKTEHGRHARVKKLGGFKQFIEMQVPRKDAYQVNMMCDSNGKLLLDFIGKLENLQEDWKTVCTRIGIPHQELQRKNASQRSHYQDYYDNESRQLVARHWAREIELFGYSFGD
jgi:Sulfotransferase family